MNKTLFIAILLVLFVLDMQPSVQTHLIEPFTQGLASLSAFLIQLFDKEVTAYDIVIQHLGNGVSVAIKPGCNGIEAMICLTAAILAYPASGLKRGIGLLTGYTAIQAMNLLRIASLFYLLQWDEQWFEWAHLYLWQGLIFLDVLIVFVVWVRWVDKPIAAPLLLNAR